MSSSTRTACAFESRQSRSGESRPRRLSSEPARASTYADPRRIGCARGRHGDVVRSPPTGWQSRRPSRQGQTLKKFVALAGRRGLLLTLRSRERTNSSQTSALMIITTPLYKRDNKATVFPNQCDNSSLGHSDGGKKRATNWMNLLAVANLVPFRFRYRQRHSAHQGAPGVVVRAAGMFRGA